MADDGWTLPASAIANVDPASLSRYIVRQGLVIQSEVNRDPIAEFCFLVVLLEFKRRDIPPDLGILVDRVMTDPQPNQVQEAVRKLNEFADSLDPDPRRGSGDVAAAWRRSKKIKEGKDVQKLDEKLLSQSSSSPPFQSSSSINPSKSQIPIQVQVWPQTHGKLDKPASEIRCTVPSLSMVGNLHNIIRYAATAGFNFPLRDGKPRSKPEKVDISSQAMFYSKSSDGQWVLRERSTRLGEVVEDSCRLQIINTKSSTLAVVAVAAHRQELSQHFIFDLNKPSEFVHMLQNCIASRRQLVRSIYLDGFAFFQMRFLTILPEEAPMPPAASSNHNPNVHPIHSSVGPSPGVAPSSSSKSHRAAPSVVHSQVQPPPAKANQPEIVDAQAPADHRAESLRSSSPASPFHPVASEDFEPTRSQVHHDSNLRRHARETPSAPSINPMSGVSAPSSSSIVMVDQSVAQSAILSKPPNQTPPTTDAPAKKKGSDLFYRRVMKKIGW